MQLSLLWPFAMCQGQFIHEPHVQLPGYGWGFLLLQASPGAPLYLAEFPLEGRISHLEADLEPGQPSSWERPLLTTCRNCLSHPCMPRSLQEPRPGGEEQVWEGPQARALCIKTL